ncbi:Uncharacterized conserved protein YdeI, YjbR/CyaY-like superfamily, DUF1801 family [Yoonia tamlensis]|uniref:Uncharacterized conserved protein YdeI, YjbR/CyaY-like superfamily, DUF1801 family n=1 Tax=Yoonia tamlensis TaxID=390270 RepID=A0A1I6FUD2_9RHOB|nr:YdeI/OmpD-associated family protein [Yoonia tamlensis]SFR33528.1 Uncharacterized conserved protein YdeI, YjbR/CyaY-like superfamily, DUF1801 family [Yoonia tamlensis]
MEVNLDRVESFTTPDEFCGWLSVYHGQAPELWIKIYKKASKIPSIDWEQAVIEALAWGWIDGIKKSNDAVSYYQRFTPRRARSNWSQKNCDHVEALLKAGRMQAPGLAQVDAAKADGRWDQAYAGSGTMEIPADFLAELADNPDAQAFYQTLSRSNIFAIYHRLHSAKRPQTRETRMAKILEALARGEKPV